MSSTGAASPDSAAFFANDAERLRFAINAAGIGIWELNIPENKVVWDARCRELFGVFSNPDTAYEDVISFIHPDDAPRVDAAVQAAIRGENKGLYDIIYRTLGVEDGTLRWVHFNGTAYFDQQGSMIRFGGIGQDITEQVLTENTQARNVSDAQELTRLALEGTGTGIYSIDLLTGACEYTADFARILTGDEHLQHALRDVFISHLHPDDLPEREAALNLGLQSGTFTYEVRTIWNDETHHRVRIVGAYTKDISGTPIRINGTIREITHDEAARIQREADLAALYGALTVSESKFRSLIEEAPFPTALYAGSNLIIDTANDEMLKLWGKSPAVVGQELEKALPELEGQPFIALLQNVYRTGITYSTKEQHADLLTDGTLKRYWFNFTYKPLRNAEGQVYAILNMAVDVSEQVQTRQAVEKSEQELASAISMAGLGTWTIDLLNQTISYSREMEDWFGVVSGTGLDALFAVVPEAEVPYLQQAIATAIAPGSTGEVNVEHNLMSAKTGQRRAIHSQGKVIYSPAGQPVVIEGISHDVTLLRQTQDALELLVQERTEALATSVGDLQRSNEELAQYAYVASHDLQEPLRKIQIFSDLLGKKNTLDPSSRELAQKISQSAGRMTQLIRDLLEFSRLLKADALFKPLDLNAVVASVFDDFELIAQEKAATFEATKLPVLEGVALQLNQLFYNLVGNSLKFTKPGVPPRIEVTSEPIPEATAATHVDRLLPGAQYYRICVKDNGIGFEKQYAEQIFEVFKRLHGRDTYPGSGIGLALCRRIIANHHGALFTESVPGQGATFCLILPDKQERLVD